ncbi:hypothetical protein B0A54_09857 [Friedmanniomyces endolithicus]|uniref:Uncharacterized protein n=1 Tax=Friedmanniomyces endolithicus TaxID=329885 RepID=A0A4U0UPU5_9PEZI|nr:hypothetical protein B0A54_09857 [Friedmanniomyces endolithicus]
MAAATATTAAARAGIWLFAALVGAGVVDAAFGGPELVAVTAPTLWLDVGVPETGADGLPVAVVIPVPVLSPPAGVEGAGADVPGAEGLVYGTGTGMMVLPELVETALGTTAVAVVVVTAAAEVEATEEAGTTVVAVVVATLGMAAGEVAE